LNKRISILFVFLLIFQTISSSFVLPSQTLAEGTGKSVFTGISFTDEDGREVNMDEVDGESAVRVHVDWSVKHVEVEEGSTASFSLPDRLHMDVEQHGLLTSDDTEVGEYQVSEDGGILVAFDEAIEEYPDAAGSFAINAVAVSDDREQAPDTAEEVETAENEEEKSDEGDTSKAVEDPEQKETDDAPTLHPEDKEDKVLDQERKAAGITAAEPLEIQDLGNIFTFESLTRDGVPIGDGDIIDIEEDTKVRLAYPWDTEGLGAKAGDTASIQLPEVFVQANIQNQPIMTSGRQVGTYSIMDGELEFVFNENIEEGDVSDGELGLELEFDLEIFEENIEQEIHFNDKEDTTLTVIARPHGDISGIDKEGHPDRNPNAREITWTIDVINKHEQPIAESTLEDRLPEGLGEPGDFHVNELTVGINGEKQVGSPVDVAHQEDGNGFEMKFENIAPFQGYRVQFTTTIDDYNIDGFTNEAFFSYGDTNLPAEATVGGLERSNPIQKDGERNDETGQIDWTITVNESGVEIDEAIVYDALPEALTLAEDSFKVFKYDGDMQGKEEAEGVEPGFPIHLGTIGADEIYQITFKTDIDWAEVNDGEYQRLNDFTNETELYDGEFKVGEDEATVGYVREALLEKSGVSNVNYDNKTLTWTVEVNKANHPLDNVVITDFIPEGLDISADDITITREDGDAYPVENIGIDTVTEGEHEGKTKVTIPLGDIGEDRIQITYTTEIEDFTMNRFDNAASLAGDGIGEDTPEDHATITPPANSFTKNFTGIDYNEKTMDWRLRVNPIREVITELEIVDTFPNNGLILLPDSLEIKVDGTKMDEGYTLTPHEEDGETGYHKGFKLTFKEPVLDLNDRMEITYQTSYDPQREIDGSTLDPHAGETESDQARIYKNHAHFTGETINGNEMNKEDDAQTTVRMAAWNSGKKEGQFVRTDDDGNLLQGWASGSERKIAWQLYTNYQQLDLGTGVKITDTLDYDGTIDEDSIQVSVYDVDQYGETSITEESLEDQYYETVVEDNTFTLTFHDQFAVNERYVIEFTTTVPDISQENYTNEAAVKVGDVEYPYAATLHYDKYDHFLEKGTVGSHDGEVFTGEEVNWEVTVNESLSVLQKDVTIADTISPGLVYVEGSLHIATIQGDTLEENEDYTLDVTINEENETVLAIKLNEDLAETFVLNYSTVVTETDGEVNNTVRLNGTGIEEKVVQTERLNARQFSWVSGEFHPEQGAIRVTKVDAEEERTIENNEAAFMLEFELNGERVQFGETFTTENGVLEIGGLPLRTYYLKEVEAPTGYVLSDEEIEINVDRPYGEDENVNEVIFENTKEKTDITAAKVWDGGESVRPDAIELQLLKNGEAYGEPVTLEAGETEYTWTDLDAANIDGEAHEYTVDEVQVPEQFEKTISEDGLTVTNEFMIENIAVSVNKVWNDANNENGNRTDSVTVKLIADGVETGEELTLHEENNWRNSFTDIPKTDREGNVITYTVEEEAVEGYESIITVHEDNPYDFTITNTELVNIAGTKTWDDADNQDGIRPEAITIHLFAEDQKMDSVEVTEADGWSYSFGDLPKYDAGEKINYTITEDEVAGYETGINGFDVTNTHTPEEIDIRGVKTWDDTDNQDGKRPETITVNLLANGVQMDSMEVTEADDWEYSFTNLPKYEAGEEIVYTITENTVEGYTQIINGFDITNQYTPGQTAATVTKHWDDANNQDGIRPEIIEVQLTADGIAQGEPVELSAENNWTHTWTELDEMAAGEPIVYSVVELTDVPEYETTIHDEDHGNIIITNSYTPELTEAAGTKTWEDGDDEAGIRPEKITVNLHANEKWIDSVEVTEAGDWRYHFENLPKYEAGEEIVYTVKEDEVEGYEATVEGYDITNTLIPVKETPTPESKDETDDPGKGEATVEDKGGTDDRLPDTATNIFQIILIGAALLFLGITFILIYKRRTV
jgi:uncharacterized surface anchored protein